MKIIGLTGGIGSGKSIVASLLKCMGAAIYDSDQHAKDLMSNNIALITQIKEAFGANVYDNNNILQRDILRELVFNKPDKLKQLNELVHTRVRIDFKKWVSEQTQSVLVFESALILNKNWIDIFDYIIYVQADESVRLKRVMDRDKLGAEIIEKIMDNQEYDKSLLLDPKIRIIDNNGTALIIPSVWNLYSDLSGS